MGVGTSPSSVQISAHTELTPGAPGWESSFSIIWFAGALPAALVGAEGQACTAVVGDTVVQTARLIWNVPPPPSHASLLTWRG